MPILYDLSQPSFLTARGVAAVVWVLFVAGLSGIGWRWWTMTRTPTTKGTIPRVIRWMLFALFTLLSFAINLIWPLQQRDQVLARAAHGNVAVVEGCVIVRFVQPLPRQSGWDRPELIVVGGKPFEVSGYTEITGYHTTILHGGLLQAGTYARLTYIPTTVGPAIIKIEGDTSSPRCPPSRP